MTSPRCMARYSLQVRCEEAAGHAGQHSHSFFARYWEDDPQTLLAEAADATPYPAGLPYQSPFTRRAIARTLPSKVTR